MRPAAALALALVAATSTACGGAVEIAGATREPSAATAASFDVVPATYGGDPPPAPASDPSTAAARALFEGGLPPELRGHVRANGWLDVAAHAAAASEFENDAAPSRSTLRWVLWRAGVTAVYDTAYADTWRITGLRMGAYAAESSRAAQLDEDMARVARKLGPSPDDRIYGIARYASGGTAMSQAVLVASTPVDVEPFAKSWQPGSTVTITIRDLHDYRAPKLYADLGSEVRSLVMEARGAGASVTFKAPATPGRAMIEVRAERHTPGAHAVVTVLHVPLWIGAPEAASARALLGPPLPPQPNPEAMATAIRTAYGAARSRASVGPLASSPRLTEVAAAAATRIAQNAGAPITPEQFREAGFEGAYNVHQQQLNARDYGDYASIRLMSPYTKWMLLQRDATLAVVVVPVPDDANGRVAIVEALAWPRR
jgi:hypothetical protein